MKTLIKDGSVVTMDPKLGELERGDVLVENDKIVAVGRNLRADADRTIDASGMVVMPDRRHRFDGCHAEIATLFVEPNSTRGAALRARFAGADVALLADAEVSDTVAPLRVHYAAGAPDAVLAQDAIGRLAPVVTGDYAPHRLMISGGYDLPLFKNSGAWLRNIAGGWKINGVVTKPDPDVSA